MAQVARERELRGRLAAFAARKDAFALQECCKDSFNRYSRHSAVRKEKG
jgi:hypothetical protein